MTDFPATAARDCEKRQAAAGPGDASAIVGRTVTINRPRDEIYAFWRDLPNLARVMESIERIDVSTRRSHWVVKAPAGKTVEWDAVITDDEQGSIVHGWKNQLEVAAMKVAGGGVSAEMHRKQTEPGSAKS